MTTILVLGHKGMLGRAVTSFFKIEPNTKVVHINARWGDDNFKHEIINIKPDVIVNCVGKIPQKQPDETDYDFINIALPRFLETLKIPIIHPSTDCEFRGDIPQGEAYSKEHPRDAQDSYGISKATISAEIEKGYNYTKIIRTSIVGHEELTSFALLDWFLSQPKSVRGYTNHFWNGVTTLEWAKFCKKLINDWDSFPALNQIGTATHYSKFEVLSLVKDAYKKDIEITPFLHEVYVNKCLISDTTITELPEQLRELKVFFKK